MIWTQDLLHHSQMCNHMTTESIEHFNWNQDI